jgi:hypothetical protein
MEVGGTARKIRAMRERRKARTSVPRRLLPPHATPHPCGAGRMPEAAALSALRVYAVGCRRVSLVYKLFL